MKCCFIGTQKYGITLEKWLELPQQFWKFFSGLCNNNLEHSVIILFIYFKKANTYILSAIWKLSRVVSVCKENS